MDAHAECVVIAAPRTQVPRLPVLFPSCAGPMTNAVPYPALVLRNTESMSCLVRLSYETLSLFIPVPRNAQSLTFTCPMSFTCPMTNAVPVLLSSHDTLVLVPLTTRALPCACPATHVIHHKFVYNTGSPSLPPSLPVCRVCWVSSCPGLSPGCTNKAPQVLAAAAALIASLLEYLIKV